MSREILFKAKTEMIVRSYNNGLDDGIWVKGYLRCDCGMWFIYQFEYDRADQVAYEVNPETICQYTGLKDKNGNKIWENDIAVRRNSQEEFIGKIIYDRNGSLCHREFQTDYEALLIGSERYVTVIGNIFDNPELLKEGIEE